MSTPTRRFGATGFGLSATPLSLGKPVAVYPGAVATDSDMIIAVDLQQTRLALPMNAIDSSMTVVDPSVIVAFSLLTIDSEIVKTTGPATGNVVPVQRGFDGTTAAVHLASAVVSGFCDAYHHNRLVAEVEAIEAALGPNLSRIPTTSQIVSSSYIFAPQTPGGNLIVGNNVITLSPVPLGVSGSDTRHYLYVSGGTGTPEAVLITGGSAVSGAASGTLIIQCANTHSGAWTIQTATAGIQEALYVGRDVIIPAGIWTINAPTLMNVGTSASFRLSGAGVDATQLTRAQNYNGDILYYDQGIFSGAAAVIRDFTIVNGGNPSFNNSGGTAVHIAQSGRTPIYLQRVRVLDGWQGFQLGSTGGCGQVSLDNCEYHQDSPYSALFQSNAGLLVGSTAGPIGNSIVSNCRFWCADQTQAFALTVAVQIQNVDGLQFTGTFIKGQVGVYFLANNNNITNVEFTNSIIDDVLIYGVLVSGNKVISSVSFVGGSINAYHGRGSHPNGIYFDGTTSTLGDFAVAHMVIDGFSQNGVAYASPSAIAAVTLTDLDILNNGDGAAGFGISIATGAVGLQIRNCRMRTIVGVPQTQNYGINIQGTLSGCSIQNNQLIGNSTAAILDAGAAKTNCRIDGNNGYNPVGPAAITVGASPFTYTAGPSPEVVYFTGGTVSLIKRGAVTVATASPASVVVPPNGTVVATYSVLPTMVKDIQ